MIYRYPEILTTSEALEAAKKRMLEKYIDEAWGLSLLSLFEAHETRRFDRLKVSQTEQAGLGRPRF